MRQVSDVSKWSDRMRRPMEEIYGDKFPALWSAWCQAYRDYYTAGGDICSTELSDIACPTLVLHGGKDSMVAGEHIHHLHTNIKGSKQVIWPEGKHNLHLKFKDEFNGLLHEFLLE